MKVIIFCSSQSELGTAVEKRILLELSNIETQQVGSMDTLIQKLCRPLNQIAVIIMLDVDERAISQLSDYKPILDHIYLILVMKEDKRPSLLPLALQLSTSFIGNPEGLDNIISVLKKIVMRIHLRNNIFTDFKL
ncbi:hypothetical protein [Desulfobacter postgatei]|uniref:hypothetical protein n=1 Tax=Desulfobacter postgatei TaxID=2293 RepID=UPI00259BA234|nr:hypothetical protein [uncultured Desulfobacter sp.]